MPINDKMYAVMDKTRFALFLENDQVKRLQAESERTMAPVAAIIRKAVDEYLHRKLIGQVGVDSGMVEIGDCGDVQLEVPTKLGDGIFPVYLSADKCKITIDTTPFVNGVSVGDLGSWQKQVAKVNARRRNRGRDVGTRDK